MTVRQCTRCGETKPLEQFRIDERGSDGHRSRCLACERQYSKDYNRTHQAERRAWRQSHKEHLAEYSAAHYQAHKERRRKERAEYAKKYHQIHRERMRNNTRKWRMNNPEKQQAQKARRRARKLEADGVLTANDIQKQRERQKGRCFYCGTKAKLTVDHVVPLSRGGTNQPTNIVLACGSCNSTKQARLPHEWPEGGRLL